MDASFTPMGTSTDRKRGCVIDAKYGQCRMFDGSVQNVITLLNLYILSSSYNIK